MIKILVFVSCILGIDCHHLLDPTLCELFDLLHEDLSVQQLQSSVKTHQLYEKEEPRELDNVMETLVKWYDRDKIYDKAALKIDFC